MSECAGDSDYHSIYQLIIKLTLNAISELRFGTFETGASGRKSGNSLMDGVGIERGFISLMTDWSLFFLFIYVTGRMVGIAEDSVRFAHFGPSHNLLRPAIAELVSCGPLPLPVSRPLKKYRKNVTSLVR